MKKWTVVLGMIGLLLVAAIVIPQAALAQGGPDGNGTVASGASPMRGSARGTALGSARGSARGVGVTGGTLEATEIKALQMALDDEYKALATYMGVMEQFGQADPFVSIARAEEQHISALARLFERYGLEMPENSWIGRTPAFDSLEDACAAAVAAEEENAALYDQLFSMVDNPDIVRVFTNLRNASEDNHLPAFESCGTGDCSAASGAARGSRVGRSGGQRGAR